MSEISKFYSISLLTLGINFLFPKKLEYPMSPLIKDIKMKYQGKFQQTICKNFLIEIADSRN